MAVKTVPKGGYSGQTRRAVIFNVGPNLRIGKPILLTPYPRLRAHSIPAPILFNPHKTLRQLRKRDHYKKQRHRHRNRPLNPELDVLDPIKRACERGSIEVAIDLLASCLHQLGQTDQNCCDSSDEVDDRHLSVVHWGAILQFEQRTQLRTNSGGYHDRDHQCKQPVLPSRDTHYQCHFSVAGQTETFAYYRDPAEVILQAEQIQPGL